MIYASMYLMNDYILNMKKSQERAAIRLAIHGKKQMLYQQSQVLSTWLQQKSEQMYHFSNNTLPETMEGGLKGIAADAAVRYLKNISRPLLNNPLRGR